MRWKTFFSLLFFCLLTFNVDGQSTLRLMSYNIRHGAGLDERLDGWILTVLQKSLIGNIRML